MKFSARYYLNLVLVDEENRRYFKQQEITIFRRQGNNAIDGSWLMLGDEEFVPQARLLTSRTSFSSK